MPGTWLEARVAKDGRLLRERRYFTVDKRGPLCPVCRTSTSKALVEATGTRVHPACDLASADLMAAER